MASSSLSSAIRRFASFGGAVGDVPIVNGDFSSPGCDLSTASAWSDVEEIEQFEAAMRRYLDGSLDPEDFRRLRLNVGVYGMRQLTDVHMVRAKIPGGSLNAAKLDALADVADEYARGWGHLTTRQNVQFHFVALADVPAALRRLAAAGITTKEACGDAVRNITACHLAGVCPLEKLDVGPVTEQLARHLLRNPIAANLPRKFKVALSGCALDCALTGIQDVGALAVVREGRPGFRVLVGGGLGSDPHEAQLLEPFTPASDLVRTVDAVLRVFDRETPDRRKRARVRLKFLVRRVGIERFRELVLSEREGSPPAPSQPLHTGAAPKHAVEDNAHTRALSELPTAHAPDPPFEAWRTTNIIAQRQPGRFGAYVSVLLGDVTAAQFRALAKLSRELQIDWRVTARQNLVATGMRSADLAELYQRLADAGLGAPGAERAASVVSCPGSETCNLALTASRGLAAATIDALVAAGLDNAPVSINVSGCPNSCAQQQLADIGLSGQVRRVGTDEAPGYRILIGGRLTSGGASFGRYLGKAPAQAVPGIVVGIVQRFVADQRDGERFAEWFDRVDHDELRRWLASFDTHQTREQAPDLFNDWGETRPFEVILGRGECAS